MRNPVLYIVIPCYNEEEVLPITCKLFLKKIKDLVQKNKISNDSRIMFVNDGSKDKTWEIISNLAKQDEHYIGICQSRNRGHQNAVLAGLMESKDHCDIMLVGMGLFVALNYSGQRFLVFRNNDRTQLC